MNIEQLFIGGPKIVNGVSTSMNRKGVQSLMIYKDKIEGDEVSNKVHHGGDRRVIHQFPLENYKILKNQFPSLNFYSGCLGENISSSKMLESEVCIGDVYQVGNVKCVVTEPRKPCWTIDHIFEKGAARFIQENCITGWFYEVLEEGEIIQSDLFKLISRPCPSLDIESCTRALLVKPDLKILKLMAESTLISPNWSTPAKRILLTGKIEDDSHRLRDN